MAREKKTDKKMIQLRIYFWTSGMVEEKGGVLPKHAWDCGHVSLPANRLHGIKAGSNKQFRTLLQLGALIEELLKESRITLHMGKGSRRYMSGDIPRKLVAN
jgi:hypothetical protein